jgi:putative hydrolase of the HAD superfamily
MNSYKHIFFDLDHTLWDFEKNCAETLRDLFQIHQLSRFPISIEKLTETYMLVNNRMWYEYNRGRMTKEEIRDTRFEITFEEMGLKRSNVPASMNQDFLNLCPTKGILLPYAHEVLSYLQDNYCLHIITNGFRETQHVKISTSKLDKYFGEIINSEVCGHLKPNREIFDFAVSKASANHEHCIMIGDDLYTDVQGAKNAGLDQIYFNPKQLPHAEEITYEIKCLSELKEIF